MSELKSRKRLEEENNQMLKMLQRIDSKMTVTFDDLLEIKKLIKEATSINEP